jgi:group I intron endonuclease
MNPNAETVGYLYRITNSVNGMQYIGVSKHPAKRFKKHCTKPSTNRKSLLGNAIQKYGSDKFGLEVLVQSTMEYCFDLEIKAIEALETRTPKGYNITAGGEGFAGFFGEDHHMYGKKKPAAFGEYMSKLFTGRPIPLEQRAKISASLKGKKQSAETIKKRTKAITGQKRSKESIERMIAAKLGKKFSEEVKDNMRMARNNRSSEAGYKKQSEAMKALWADPAYKEKMRIAFIKRKEVTHGG